MVVVDWDIGIVFPFHQWNDLTQEIRFFGCKDGFLEKFKDFCWLGDLLGIGFDFFDSGGGRYGIGFAVGFDSMRDKVS